jgi:hypothetical protein
VDGGSRGRRAASEAYGGAVGARQRISVVVPVAVEVDPPWAAGPLPYRNGVRVADAGERRGLFTPAAGRALYEGRWHTWACAVEGPLRLEGMELLRIPTARAPRGALAVLHLVVEPGTATLPLLRAISHRRQVGRGDPLSGALAPGELLRGVADTTAPAGPFAPARPYTVAFLAPGAGLGPLALRDPVSGELPPEADHFLRSLASRSAPEDLPLAPEVLPELRAKVRRISAGWSALVLRQGAAFLGHRPDTGPGDFYDWAEQNARTVYLDALLLGIAQRMQIDELTDDLSAVFEGPGLARRVADLEQRIARFRSTYWRQHLAAHGPANDLLIAYQATHRLPERFEQVLAEAADQARLVQTRESQQIAGALGVLTVLGLPLGTALSILQVLGDSDPRHLLAALAAALAATAAALTTRYGRLVLSSLRAGTRRR